MKKIALIASTIFLGLICQDMSAQTPSKRRKKKTHVPTEQEESRPEEFVVNGFASDKDHRIVKKRDPNNNSLNGFDNTDDYLATEVEKNKKRTRKAKKPVKNTTASGKPKPNRDIDIESLMGDLVLGKIQKPVFRGVMTEHLRDVNGVLAKEGVTNADKNVTLKQLYVLRNKRLSEVLNDTQYNKWLKIKDQDEYLAVEEPEDI
jgi:hypothetical protein